MEKQNNQKKYNNSNTFSSIINNSSRLWIL